MDLNGLLTVIGLIIAAYAILSRDRRLNILLHLGISEITLILVTTVAVHYFQFYDYLKEMGMAMELESIAPRDISYILIIFTISLLIIKVRYGKISGIRIFKFQELVEELNNLVNHSVLITLLDRNLEYVVQASKNESFLQRVREWLTTPTCGHIDLMKNMSKPEGLEISIPRKVNYKKWIKRIFYWLVFLIPNHKNRVTAAHNILRTTFLNDNFAESIVKIYPYFGIRTFAYELYEFTEFAEIYLKQLFKKQDSILYFEIRNNQNISSNHRYFISESNRLLHALFSNCKVAERLSAWKPIGEGLNEYLDYLNKNRNTDEYNFEIGTFDRDFLKYPISIGIRYFDIMVTEAIFQNIRWHMWFYYFPTFTKKICRNFEPKVSEENLEFEFPTKYSSILYNIIATQCDWIDILEDLPKEQDNIQLRSSDNSGENGNIIKSSIISLTECLYTISNTETIPYTLKKTIFSRAFSQYFKLRNNRQAYILRYADAYWNCLLLGGSYHKVSESYTKTLLLSILERDNLSEIEIAGKVINDIFTYIERSFGFDRYRNIEAIADWLPIVIEKQNEVTYIKSKTGPYRYRLDIADSA
jgi:hypothetical protein